MCLPQVFLWNKKGNPKNIEHMPLLRMWWHWQNHLHRSEFKERVSHPAQQESIYILNTWTIDETTGHAPYESSSLPGDLAITGENGSGADEWIWTYCVCGSFFWRALYGNEALCFRDASERRVAVVVAAVVTTQRCCLPCMLNSFGFREVVLLG